MITFWESEKAIRAFAGEDIKVAKYYHFDKDFRIEMEPSSTHYDTYDRWRESAEQCHCVFQFNQHHSTIASLTTKSAPKISLLYRASQSGR